MVLLGAEQVQHGGSAAREAGQDMLAAASKIEFALQQHQRFLDDWLDRLELVLRVREGTK